LSRFLIAIFVLTCAAYGPSMAVESKAGKADDDACVNLAATILGGVEPGDPLYAQQVTNNITRCNDNPNRSTCDETVSMLATGHKAIPRGLDCHNNQRAAKVPQRVPTKSEESDGACSSLAANAGGPIQSMEADWVAKCNASPNICEIARDIIQQEHHPVPPGLTCR
jgi:hypothetical protein